MELSMVQRPIDSDTGSELDTLQAALMLGPIPVDETVASAWARLRLTLREAGLRLGVNDSWIAATALAHDLVVVTQDENYHGIPGLNVLQL